MDKKITQDYDNQVEEIINLYVETNLHFGVIEAQTLTNENVNHIKSIAKSIVKHRDGKQMSGSFVTAIVHNNLDQAISNADNVCIRALKLFVLVKNWVHIN